MTATRVKCHCAGRPDCRLCLGTGEYAYEPGPRGWMPFRCPTCEGTGRAAGGDAGGKCPTCRGVGAVDPADPPPRGMFDTLWKSLVGF